MRRFIMAISYCFICLVSQLWLFSYVWTYDIESSINLLSPLNGTSFDSCSIYSLPTFSWSSKETLKSSEIQFSSDSSFISISNKIKSSGNVSEVTISSYQWKKVLKMPGTLLGGIIYWRVVGTQANGDTAISETFSIVVSAPQCVKNPSISNTTKETLPTLSWENKCNTKFKVYFGSDEGFTNKTYFQFNLKNPGDNEGVFTKTLNSWQWKTIRKLVEDLGGSYIYWYVESWDALERYAKTEVMRFILLGYMIRVGGIGPHPTIQEAINVAQDGDTIQVAQGTYMENITITTSKTLWFQGGWNTDFTSRSVDSSLTRIDGGASGSVFEIRADPDVSITLDIDGFTIQNGAAEEGGGIRAASYGPGSTITLQLTNNTITGNLSTTRGGGIYMVSRGASFGATLTDNIISANMANNEGGGIRVESSDGGSTVVTLTKNIVEGNAVTFLMTGEGGYDGGGIAVYASGSGITTVLLENNLILNNEAFFGGGVFGYAWGTNAEVAITLTNNIISGNEAPYGGAIFSCSGQTCPVSRPGGLVSWKLTNNTITGNHADEDVGGIFAISGSEFGDGGAIEFILKNDIVWGNTAPITYGGQEIKLHTASGVVTANVAYSDIGSFVCTGGSTYTFTEVISEDPMFVDPANQVFLLQDGSPAIDAGDPNPVYNDGYRPPGKGTERADMGAYGGPNNNTWP